MQQAHADIGLAPAIHQDQVAGDEEDDTLPERAARGNDADRKSRIARHPAARDRVHGRNDRAEAEQPHDRMVDIEFANAGICRPNCGDDRCWPIVLKNSSRVRSPAPS